MLPQCRLDGDGDNRLESRRWGRGRTGPKSDGGSVGAGFGQPGGPPPGSCQLTVQVEIREGQLGCHAVTWREAAGRAAWRAGHDELRAEQPRPRARASRRDDDPSHDLPAKPVRISNRALFRVTKPVVSQTSLVVFVSCKRERQTNNHKQPVRTNRCLRRDLGEEGCRVCFAAGSKGGGVCHRQVSREVVDGL